MRKLKISCCVSLLLLSQAGFAFPEISISVSTPFPNSLSVGSTATAVYTIVNNTNHQWPLNLYGFSGSLTRVTVGSDCVSTIPASPGFCSFGITATPSSTDVGAGINQTLVLDYAGRVPATIPVSISIPSFAAAKAPIIIEMGTSITNQPLLFTSSDDGKTFHQKNSAGFIDAHTLNALACTEASATGICVLTGTNVSNGTPIIAASINGGATWGLQKLTNVTFNEAGLSKHAD